VNWLRGHSDYDTEIVPEYEDQILMLSTCSYHTKNGRFVVAARRVAEP
jgi:sortase B